MRVLVKVSGGGLKYETVVRLGPGPDEFNDASLVEKMKKDGKLKRGPWKCRKCSVPIEKEGERGVIVFDDWPDWELEHEVCPRV